VNGVIDLASLCGREGSPIGRPYSVELDGVEWVVATDGRGLLMLRGETVVARGEMTGDYLRETVLAKVGPSVTEVSYADLASVFRCDALVPCADCAGSGAQECPLCGTDNVVCEPCDGEGHVVVPELPGELGGLVVNETLVWRYLREVYAPLVRVHPATGEGRQQTPAMFAAADDSWRVVVMGMGPTAFCPELPIQWRFPRGLLGRAA
jgi:hypothetical protein